MLQIWDEGGARLALAKRTFRISQREAHYLSAVVAAASLPAAKVLLSEDSREGGQLCLTGSMVDQGGEQILPAGETGQPQEGSYLLNGIISFFKQGPSILSTFTLIPLRGPLPTSQG